MIKKFGAMKNLKQAAFFGLMILSVGAMAQSQCTCDANYEDGWCWGTDPDKSKEKNALYTDAYKVKSFQAAADHLQWLLDNTPCLNKSIYMNGSKIYEGLANLEKDKAKKLALAERSLEMYDLRIQNFGEEAKVLNRKAFAAYKLLRNSSSKYQELLDLFDKAFELNKNKFQNNNILGYMDVMRRYKEAGNELSDDKIFEVYFAMTDLMDYKESVGGSVGAKTRENVENLLLRLDPKIDCELVISDFGPKLEANPDVNMAKKIFQLMLTGKCTDHPLALKAAKMVDDSEPSYGIKIFIAGRSLANGDKETALNYYNQAIDLTDENVKKADIYLKIARIKSTQGLKVQAREHANKALAADPTMKEAYKVIGDLYMNSFEDCAGLKKVSQDRAVFIAAYNMYKRAGDASAMARAKAQFPSISDIFNDNMKEGDAVTVSCWINTTVKLERRPEN